MCYQLCFNQKFRIQHLVGHYEENKLLPSEAQYSNKAISFMIPFKIMAILSICQIFLIIRGKWASCSTKWSCQANASYPYYESIADGCCYAALCVTSVHHSSMNCNVLFSHYFFQLSSFNAWDTITMRKKKGKRWDCLGNDDTEHSLAH